MNVGDLKAWLATLPPELNSMSVVCRQYDEMKTEGKNEDGTPNDYYYALDIPMVSGYIDEESRECCLLDEKSRQFIITMNTKLNEKNLEGDK